MLFASLEVFMMKNWLRKCCLRPHCKGSVFKSDGIVFWYIWLTLSQQITWQFFLPLKSLFVVDLFRPHFTLRFITMTQIRERKSGLRCTLIRSQALLLCPLTIYKCIHFLQFSSICKKNPVLHHTLSPASTFHQLQNLPKFWLKSRKPTFKIVCGVLHVHIITCEHRKQLKHCGYNNAMRCKVNPGQGNSQYNEESGACWTFWKEPLKVGAHKWTNPCD